MSLNKLMNQEASFVEQFYIPKIQNPFYQEKDIDEADFDLVTKAASRDLVATMFDGTRGDVIDLMETHKKNFIGALRDAGHNEEADKISNIKFSNNQISDFLFAMIEPDEEVQDGNE